MSEIKRFRSVKKGVCSYYTITKSLLNDLTDISIFCIHISFRQLFTDITVTLKYLTGAKE